MGDAGSIPLGFLAAAMGLWGWQQGHWPTWFPVLVFSPFVADASDNLLKPRVDAARGFRKHIAAIITKDWYKWVGGTVILQ